MILLIDNYDSFVFNIARYMQEMGQETVVIRNDGITPDEVLRMSPAAVVLSPGPCTPAESGVSVKLVHALADAIPILGICLGHQAIVAAFGGKIVRAPEPVHGRTAKIRHDGSALFAGLSNPFTATRYHSLILDEETLPDELIVSARSDDGLPMAVRHRDRLVFGVQFHPESVLSEYGHRLLSNFLRFAGISVSRVPAGDRIPPAAAESDCERASTPLHWF
ncbi:MAG: aminodeoxychorismate/anthranilate synthase component II [Planctomycetes bacterium]|nr:aminodeoxychorismate/anthranilate synthase component II [Planctomycetota bacterium]